MTAAPAFPVVFRRRAGEVAGAAAGAALVGLVVMPALGTFVAAIATMNTPYALAADARRIPAVAAAIAALCGLALGREVWRQARERLEVHADRAVRVLGGTAEAFPFAEVARVDRDWHVSSGTALGLCVATQDGRRMSLAQHEMEQGAARLIEELARPFVLERLRARIGRGEAAEFLEPRRRHRAGLFGGALALALGLAGVALAARTILTRPGDLEAHLGRAGALLGSAVLACLGAGLVSAYRTALAGGMRITATGVRGAGAGASEVPWSGVRAATLLAGGLRIDGPPGAASLHVSAAAGNFFVVLDVLQACAPPGVQIGVAVALPA